MSTLTKTATQPFMTTHQKMAEMREHGCKISIHHYRYVTEDPSGDMVLAFNHNKYKEKYGPRRNYAPCGGLTFVRVIRKLERVYRAECSKKDNFSYAYGTALAISRAYEDFLRIKETAPKEKPDKSISQLSEASEYYVVVGYDDKKLIGFLRADACEGNGVLVPVIDPPNGTLNEDDYTLVINEARIFPTYESARNWTFFTGEKIIKFTYNVKAEYVPIS
jgi:hypothetical protein